MIGVEAADLVKLPTLKAFTARLAARLAQFDPPPAIYIHAPTNISIVAPLVTHIIEKTSGSHAQPLSDLRAPSVQDLLPKIAVIDLEEIHSTRQAFDRILNQLSGWNCDELESTWESQSHKALNWDGRTEGLSVVKRVGRRKRNSSRDDGGHARKKRRPDVSSGARVETTPSTTSESDEEEDMVPSWQLDWDRNADASRSDFEPLKDTVEHFHYSLSKIMALGEEKAPESLQGSEQAANRWIIINHAEMLNELTVTGTALGAGKETGLGMTLLGALLRTRELARIPLSIVLISNFGFTKARDSLVGMSEPVLFDFPDLTRSHSDPNNDEWNDTLAVLATRFARSVPRTAKLSRDETLELFQSLTKIVWNNFSKWATDIESIAYLVAKFWPKWLDCVENNNPPISYKNVAALHSHLKADLNKERDLIAANRTTVHTPMQGQGETKATASVERPAPSMHGFVGLMPSLPAAPKYLATPGSPGTPSAQDVFGSSPIRPQAADIDDDPVTPIRDRILHISPGSSARGSPDRTQQLAVALKSDQTLAKSLPVISRFLLLASYYASFNPAKSDVRCFVRIDESVARKGKKGRRLAAPKPGSPNKNKLSTDLSGGINFPLERLLAIFGAIYDDENEEVAQSSDVLMQTTTLINLRLLHRVSAADKLLDNVKLRCMVSKDTVDVLAKSVGMHDWRQFLYDPDA